MTDPCPFHKENCRSDGRGISVPLWPLACAVRQSLGEFHRFPIAISLDEETRSCEVCGFAWRS